MLAESRREFTSFPLGPAKIRHNIFFTHTRKLRALWEDRISLCHISHQHSQQTLGKAENLVKTFSPAEAKTHAHRENLSQDRRCDRCTLSATWNSPTVSLIFLLWILRARFFPRVEGKSVKKIYRWQENIQRWKKRKILRILRLCDEKLARLVDERRKKCTTLYQKVNSSVEKSTEANWKK